MTVAVTDIARERFRLRADCPDQPSKLELFAAVVDELKLVMASSTGSLGAASDASRGGVAVSAGADRVLSSGSPGGPLLAYCWDERSVERVNASVVRQARRLGIDLGDTQADEWDEQQAAWV